MKNNFIKIYRNSEQLSTCCARTTICISVPRKKNCVLCLVVIIGLCEHTII